MVTVGDRAPDLDGIRATELVVAEPDAPHVLALTTIDVDERFVEALPKDASGYCSMTVTSPSWSAPSARSRSAYELM